MKKSHFCLGLSAQNIHFWISWAIFDVISFRGKIWKKSNILRDFIFSLQNSEKIKVKMEQFSCKILLNIIFGYFPSISYLWSLWEKYDIVRKVSPSMKENCSIISLPKLAITWRWQKMQFWDYIWTLKGSFSIAEDIWRYYRYYEL